jgi:hypothetical protein
MPKADSDDTTTPSADTLSADNTVAIQDRTLLNERAGDHDADDSVQESTKMTRRNAIATAAAGAASLSLTLQPSQASTRRRLPAFRNAGNGQDPLIAAFNTYGRLATTVAKAQIAKEKFDKEHPGTTNTDLDQTVREAVAEETAGLDLIKQTVPTTMNGIAHVVQFLINIAKEEEAADPNLALLGNMAKAIEFITGRPAPKVTGYYYNWQDVLT